MGNMQKLELKSDFKNNCATQSKNLVVYSMSPCVDFRGLAEVLVTLQLVVHHEPSHEPSQHDEQLMRARRAGKAGNSRRHMIR